MALDKTQLVNDLKDLQQKLESQVEQDRAKDDWVNGLADIIDRFVRTATVVVTIPSGAIVTTGSPSSQTNALGVVATSDDNFVNKAGLR